MKPRFLSALAALALITSLVQPAFAYLITTHARPLAPAIAYAAPFGSYLMVWAEDRGTGTGLDVYAARLNPNGIVQGYDVPVIVAPGNQSDPTLAFSEQVDQFMLVYTDDSGGAGNPSGNPTPGLPIPGTPTGPGTTATPPPPPGPPPPPFAAGRVDRLAPAGPLPGGALSAGMVVLPSPGDPAAGPEPRDGRDADQPPPPPFQTATPGPTATPGGNPPPPVAQPGSRDLYGTFLAVNGVRASVIFPVVLSPADDTYPDLAYMWRGRTDGLGDRIALVWREVTGVDSAIKALEIIPYGRFFDPYDRPDTVVAGGDLGRPSVAAEVTQGEYLVVWSQTPTDDPARDLYGRRLNANAFPYRPIIRLVTAKAPIDDVYPSVGSLFGAGGYVLAWERRDGANGPDIQTRRLNVNGIPYRNVNALAGGAAFSFAPDASSTLRDDTLVVWIDRNAASDHSIMAARVTKDGRRIGPERLVVQGGVGPNALTPVAPPGFPTLPPPPLPTP